MPLTLVTTIDADRAKRMVKKIAEKFGTTYEHALFTRDAQACAIKAGICHVLRQRGFSLPAIGKVLHKDHTSVLNLLKYIINIDAEGYKAIDQIISQHLPTLTKGMVTGKVGGKRAGDRQVQTRMTATMVVPSDRKKGKSYPPDK